VGKTTMEWNWVERLRLNLMVKNKGKRGIGRRMSQHRLRRREGRTKKENMTNQNVKRREARLRIAKMRKRRTGAKVRKERSLVEKAMPEVERGQGQDSRIQGVRFERGVWIPVSIEDAWHGVSGKELDESMME
jgi:hypothetical protein